MRWGGFQCHPLSPQASPKLSPQAEAERPGVATLRPGATLTGKFLSTSSIPGCLLGVALDGDPPAGPASLLQHVLLLEQARQQSTLIAGESPPCLSFPPLPLPQFPPTPPPQFLFAPLSSPPSRIPGWGSGCPTDSGRVPPPPQCRCTGSRRWCRGSARGARGR